MSLDREAVRLAYLSKANKRADERMLNIPQSEVQEDKKYAGSGFGRRGLSTQMPRSRKARKFLTQGRDLILDTAPDILDKIPGVPDVVKKGAKALRGVKRAVKGRGKTGGSHKGRYDVEEDVAITTGGERLKRVKGRGMTRAVGGAKKQSRKDKEDEKLGAEVRGLKDKMSGGAKKKAKKNAEKMGEMYGKEVVSMDDDVKELVGSGFFEDFGRGFMKGLRMVSGVAKKVLPVVAPGVGTLASAGLSAVGLGKAENVREYMSESDEEMEGGAGLQDDLAYAEAVNMNRTRAGGSKCRQGTEMKGRHSRKGGAMTGGGLMDIFNTASAVVKFLGGLSPTTRGKLASGEHLTSRERDALFKKLRGKGVEMPDMGDIEELRKVASKHSRKGGAMTGGRKRGQSEKMKRRNAMVSKLMREEGMSLPQASKYIKEHNLL